MYSAQSGSGKTSAPPFRIQKPEVQKEPVPEVPVRPTGQVLLPFYSDPANPPYAGFHRIPFIIVTDPCFSIRGIEAKERGEGHMSLTPED